ncbi:MAG: DUF433 domain-containing protein [Verrucomicrobia bacterium]|nr:DUF433 domain-containing protein [Verrucomicrobiota bacterium]
MKHPRIEINPAVMVGKPVIRGTRIPVELILRKLAASVSVSEILRDYPRLTEADITAAVAYAADALATDEILEFAEAVR